MAAFLAELIKASVIGGLIWLGLLLFKPLTDKTFSQTWHYYTGLIPAVFFLGATYVAAHLTAAFSGLIETTAKAQPVTVPPVLHSLPIASGAVPIPTSAAIPVSIPAAKLPEPAAAFVSETFDTAYNFAAQIQSFFTDYALLILAVWLIGCTAFLTWKIASYVRIKRGITMLGKPADVQCILPVLVCPHITTPMLIGVIRPVIVLPERAYSKQELELILAHEQTHWRRGDMFIKLMLLIVNAIHWFNPLAYLMNTETARSCENACDEGLTRNMNRTERILYGKVILSAAAGKNAAVLCAGMGAGKNLKRRLLYMLKFKKMRKSMVALSLAVALAITVGGIWLSGSMKIVAAETEVTDDVSDDETRPDSPFGDRPSYYDPELNKWIALVNPSFEDFKELMSLVLTNQAIEITYADMEAITLSRGDWFGIAEINGTSFIVDLQELEKLAVRSNTSVDISGMKSLSDPDANSSFDRDYLMPLVDLTVFSQIWSPADEEAVDNTAETAAFEPQPNEYGYITLHLPSLEEFKELISLVMANPDIEVTLEDMEAVTLSAGNWFGVADINGTVFLADLEELEKLAIRGNTSVDLSMFAHIVCAENFLYQEEAGNTGDSESALCNAIDKTRVGALGSILCDNCPCYNCKDNLPCDGLHEKMSFEANSDIRIHITLDGARARRYDLPLYVHLLHDETTANDEVRYDTRYGTATHYKCSCVECMNGEDNVVSAEDLRIYSEEEADTSRDVRYYLAPDGEQRPYYTRNQLQYAFTGEIQYRSEYQQYHIQPETFDGVKYDYVDNDDPWGCNNSFYYRIDGTRVCSTCGYIFTADENTEIGWK